MAASFSGARATSADEDERRFIDLARSPVFVAEEQPIIGA
jgi:hypothetical protein